MEGAFVRQTDGRNLPRHGSREGHVHARLCVCVDLDGMSATCRTFLSDPRVLRLIRMWLKAGVMEEGQLRKQLTGTPQGGCISPLLSNVYLHAMDKMWRL